jgi:hypothetical protein
VLIHGLCVFVFCVSFFDKANFIWINTFLSFQTKLNFIFFYKRTLQNTKLSKLFVIFRFEILLDNTKIKVFGKKYDDKNQRFV